MNKEYIFIHYGRKDYKRVVPYIRKLQEGNYSVKEISLDYIDQAAECLVFVSQRAVLDHHFRQITNYLFLSGGNVAVIYLENVSLTPALAMQLSMAPYTFTDQADAQEVHDWLRSVTNQKAYRSLEEMNLQEREKWDEPTSVLARVHIYLVRELTGEKIPVDGLRFRIGKSPKKCDYVISDNPTISREHAEIFSYDQRSFVKDLYSTNGTYLNQVQVLPDFRRELHHNDILQFSDESFRVLIEWSMPLARVSERSEDLL